jgi:hypothetical protein
MSSQKDKDDSVRKHVLNLLRGGGAHQSFDEFVNSFPADLCGRQIEGLPYTPWQVLEHMRLAQWDILEFSRDSDHISPDFPKGYWPPPDETGTPALWQKTIDAFHSDLQQMEALLEALLIADHNAYHLGALAVMARILKAGPND